MNADHGGGIARRHGSEGMCCARVGLMEDKAPKLNSVQLSEGPVPAQRYKRVPGLGGQAIPDDSCRRGDGTQNRHGSAGWSRKMGVMEGSRRYEKVRIATAGMITSRLVA